MLIGMATFLLSVIALLAIPLTLTFKISWQGVLLGEVKLRWFFGFVRTQILPFQSKSRSPAKKEEIQPTPNNKRLSKRLPKKSSAKSGKRNNPIAAILQKSFRQRIIKFLRDIWRAIKKDNVRLRMCIGLGDPADTGQLWALLGPVAGVLSNAREAEIDIEPDFFDARFSIEGQGSIQIVPLQLIYLAIALLLSPSIWRGISVAYNVK